MDPRRKSLVASRESGSRVRISGSIVPKSTSGNLTALRSENSKLQGNIRRGESFVSIPTLDSSPVIKHAPIEGKIAKRNFKTQLTTYELTEIEAFSEVHFRRFPENLNGQFNRLY